jgi:hypothetical protein
VLLAARGNHRGRALRPQRIVLGGERALPATGARTRHPARLWRDHAARAHAAHRRRTGAVPATPNRGRVGAHHLPEKLLGGQPGDGAGDQPSQVRVARRASKQRLPQRHGQRVAAPQPDQVRTAGRGNAGSGEQLVALRLVEVLEPMDRDHRAPTRIGAPGRGRGVAAGQDDHAVSRQGGQERLPQPSVDRAELLVAVDQQDGAREQVGGRAAARPFAERDEDGVLEPLR